MCTVRGGRIKTHVEGDEHFGFTFPWLCWENPRLKFWDGGKSGLGGGGRIQPQPDPRQPRWGWGGSEAVGAHMVCITSSFLVVKINLKPFSPPPHPSFIDK